MKRVKVAFHTLGCKVNSYETEAVKTMFEAASFDVVQENELSDVTIINTCTVTNQSAAKSRKIIRQAIKRNPDAIIAVMGCYTQLEPEQVKAISGVDIIIGTSKRDHLLSYVQTVIKDRQPMLEVEDVTKYKTFDRLSLTHYKDQTRAYLKIQDGCNQYCTYCIIPFARGPMRSRAKQEVLEEARMLIQNGYQEIILTGIHTGGYGSDLIDTSFTDLCEALSQLKGLKRLRISSIEMNQITPRLLELIQYNPIFVPHLHIPIQSGANVVLKAMKRHYTTQEFEAKIQSIRTHIPNIAITTDVMVGFPGETDADFEETVETLTRIGFSEMHIFPYSKRQGTMASNMQPQVLKPIKTLRVQRLLELNRTLAFQYAKSLKNTFQTVLFEQCDGVVCQGHTEYYLTVKVNTESDLSNTLHPVKLTTIDYPEIEATLVGKSQSPGRLS